jgi:hypothetical protein
MKKLFVFLILAFSILNSQLSIATVLSDAAAKLSPGQFAIVTGMTNLQATAAAYDPAPASPGPGYDGGQPGWDPLARKLYMEMTEHGNASACPGSFPSFPNWCWKPLWTYDDATDTWATNGPYPTFTSGGGPVSGVHTWGYTAWDNTNKTLYVRGHDTNIGTWWQFFRYCASNSPASYCASQLGQWNQITGLNPSSGSQVGTQLGWHPNLNGGTLLAFDTDGNNAGCGALFGYREGVGWAIIDSGSGCKYPAAATTLNRIIYSPQKDVAVFGPSETNALKLWRIGATGAPVALDTAPCAFTTTDGGFSQTAEDPNTGDIIFIGCTSAGQMWRLNPTAASGSQWTQMHATLNAPGQICNVMRSSGQICGFDFLASPISTYGVIGFWKMRLGVSGGIGPASQGAEYWIYKPSATSGDTTPPTVSVTAPSAGGTVSGTTVTLSANASDNIGVSGVQFKVDGANVSVEDTTSPYSITWDSTTVSNAAHLITAVARDAAGNNTTSSSISVAVSNAGGGGSDFTTRCNAAIAAGGRCIGFDSSSEIANTAWGSNTGLDLGFNGGKPPPIIDTSIKASGAGSLMFTISSQSPANGAGAYWANFSSDLSTRYGAGQTFYVQWRQRFSPEQLSNVYNAIGGGIDNGWKTADITTGDRAGSCTSAEAAEGCQNQLGVAAFTSCTAIELVTQNVLQRGFLQAYQSCTGSSSRPFAYAGFQRQYPSGIIPLGMDCGLDCYLQDATATPFCLYSQRPGVGSGFFPPNGNCIAFVANEWMTFKIKLTIGPRGSGGVPGASPNDEFVNSNFQMWIAREGQPSIQAFNYGPFNMSAGSTTADLKFGKVYLEPYQTAKDPAQVHPIAYTWYDELIMSPQDIADPGAGGGTVAAPTTIRLSGGY